MYNLDTVQDFLIHLSIKTHKPILENKHFFTKSFCRQTYQNSKISWQKMPISDFQSEFSMSKIIRIFLNFFFIEEYQFRGMFLFFTFFENFNFESTLFSKFKQKFWQMILEFW